MYFGYCWGRYSKVPYQFVGDASLLTSDKASLNEPSSLISTCVDILSSWNSTKSKTQRLNRCPEKTDTALGVKFTTQFVRRKDPYLRASSTQESV